MQLLVVSNSIKTVYSSMIHVVQLIAVHQQFRRNLIHGSSSSHGLVDLTCRCLSAVVRLQFMVRSGRLVQPVVQLLVQLVR